MPTTLPARLPPFDPTADFLGFLRALARMYGMFAIAIAFLIAAEAGFGLFAGRTVAASIVIATGTELPQADNARLGALTPLESAAF
jgi:hypothetical protein